MYTKLSKLSFYLSYLERLGKKSQIKRLKLQNLTEKNKKYQLYTCNEQSQLTLTNIFFWHFRPEPV